MRAAYPQNRHGTLGSIIIFLCVLSQLGVGGAWNAGRATSPKERQRARAAGKLVSNTQRNKANIDSFWRRPEKHSGDDQYSQLLSYILSLLGAARKRKALRKPSKPGTPDRAQTLGVYAD